MVAPFWAAWRAGFFLDAAEDFAEAGLGGALAAELFVELTIGRDQGGGAMNDKCDLVGSISFVGEEDDAGKGGDVVLDGAEGVVEVAGNLVGLLALEEEADGLHAMSLSGADVLLLAACGNLEAAAAQDGDVADEGAEAAVE
jgi:hypothetical protein